MSPSICFPFRLLSHENLWGFGFPSQLGTGHFFWNLEFPQDGKTICCSATCVMRLHWKSELFSSWTNKSLPGQMFFLSLSMGLALAFSLPCPWQHPGRCVWGFLCVGRAGCLNGGKGSPRWLLTGEQSGIAAVKGARRNVLAWVGR